VNDGVGSLRVIIDVRHIRARREYAMIARVLGATHIQSVVVFAVCFIYVEECNVITTRANTPFKQRH